jgi:tetratricopeptide (TPR) repeat protein
MPRLGVVSLLALLLLLLLLEKAACAPPGVIDLSEPAPTVYERGLDHLRRGEYREARTVVESALKGNPSNAALHALLGDAYVGLRDFDRAIEAYTQAILHGCRQGSVYNNRGGMYASRKDWIHAIEDYTKVIAIDPDRPEGYYGRAGAYLGQRQYAKARSDFEASYKRGRGNVAAYYLAQLLAACPDATVRDGQKAIEYARMICERTEFKEPVYLDILAAAHAEAGQWEQAVHRAKQALSLAEKRNYEGGEYCAEVRMHLELYRLHEPYRKLPPEHPADQSLSSAVEALHYGVAKTGIGDYKKALLDLRKAVELNPRLASAHYYLGCALTQLGYADEAIGHFNRCLELDPKNSDAFVGQAINNNIVGKFREALAAAKSALAINSRNFCARLTHAWALGGRGELDRALQELDQLDREYPGNDRVHFVRGEFYLQQRRLDDAVDEFTKAIQRNNRSVLAYAERAVALSALGKAEEAKRDLEECIQLAPALQSQTEGRIKEIVKDKLPGS